MSSPDASSSGLTQGAVEAGRYDGHLDHPSEVAGILHEMMPAKARVLDVGCGTGSVAIIANRGRDNSLHALEPDADRAAIARSRGINCEVGYLDASYLATHQAFDVVVASDVMEHTSDPHAFLQLLHRAMRLEGAILLSVPNVAHWSVRLALMAGRFDYTPTGIMDATHLRWFTEATLRKVVSAAGLEIRQYAYSAGSDLQAYRHGLWKILPYRIRIPLIRRLVRLFPRLFGVQHVVKLGRAVTATSTRQLAAPA